MHAHSSHAALHRTRACTAARRRTHIGSQHTKAPRVSQQLVAVTDAVVLTRARAHTHTHRGSKGLYGPRYSHSRLQNTGDNRALAAAIKSKQQNGQERNIRPPVDHTCTHASARAHTHTNTPTVSLSSPRRVGCAAPTPSERMNASARAPTAAIGFARENAGLFRCFKCAHVHIGRGWIGSTRLVRHFSAAR